MSPPSLSLCSSTREAPKCFDPATRNLSRGLVGEDEMVTSDANGEVNLAAEKVLAPFSMLKLGLRGVKNQAAPWGPSFAKVLYLRTFCWEDSLGL